MVAKHPPDRTCLTFRFALKGYKYIGYVHIHRFGKLVVAGKKSLSFYTPDAFIIAPVDILTIDFFMPNRVGNLADKAKQY